MKVNQNSKDYMRTEYTNKLYGSDNETVLERRLEIRGSDGRVSAYAGSIRGHLLP
jgi:ethanolamine utilization protein EutQ (cupin superfamily)